MKKYMFLCGISVLLFSLCVGNSQAQWFPPSYTYSPSMLLPVYPIYYSGNYMLGYGSLPLLPCALLNAARFSKITGSPSSGSPSKVAPTTTIPFSSYYFPTLPAVTVTTSYYLYNVNYLTSLYYFPPTTTSAYGTWGLLDTAIPFPFP